MQYLQPFSKSILIIGLSVWLAACGGGGGGGDDDEEVVVDPIALDFVLALFTTNGDDWNDYVAGSDFVIASDTACNAASPPCIHGGEVRVVEATGKSSCAGLTARDDLDAFVWRCDGGTNPVRLISSGFKPGKSLSDLINFATPAFRSNAVTVFESGIAWGITPSSVWWANPLVVNNSGGSLATASTIYLVTTDPTAAYSLDNDSVALVIEPGLSMSGPGTNVNVISATSRDYLWLEGEIDASDDQQGVNLNTVRFSVLRNLTANNAQNNGVALFDSTHNRLEEINASNNNNRGIGVFSGSDNNKLAGLMANNNGIGVSIDGDNNTITGLTASNNGTGLELFNPVNNRFSGVTASTNDFGVNSPGGDNNIFAGVTVSNNGSGFILSQGSNNNTISSLAAGNNSIGARISGSNFNTLLDVTSSNGSTGIELDTSSDNTFTGLLQVGNNTVVDCNVTAGTNPGLVDITCAINGNSNHTLVNNVSIANSFVGKVTSDDGQNTFDTNGGVLNYPANPVVFDWLNFDNFYRGWGFDGSPAFPSADQRARWLAAAGRIWDWSVASSDTGNGGNPALLGVHALPTGNDILTHVWSGAPVTNDDVGCNTMINGSIWNGSACQSVFLINAVEIPQDGIGNDNNLCETAETCLYSPNIGSYQGHGNLVNAGAFNNGTLSGITLMRYATNGR